MTALTAAPRPSRWRLVAHVASFLGLWPIWSAWHASAERHVGSMVRMDDASAPVRLAMALTAFEMWREFLAVGVLLCAATALGSRLVRRRAGPDSPSRVGALLAGFTDSLLVAAALALGIALELPAALSNAELLLHIPVSTGLLGLGAALAGLALAKGVSWEERRLRYGYVILAGVIAATGWAAARFPPAGATPTPVTRARVVLGLDSLSRTEPVEPLRRIAAAHGGTWYERAVTPGLLTNSVWTAIVSTRPPSETGVFYLFQRLDWAAEPDDLVDRARAAGLVTYAFFSDQLTMHLGADLPFDENRSGPTGWKQVTTVAVKDASWFLPVLLPHLPSIPGAATPRNQAGTFAFSLRLELQDIFSAGGAGGSLVLAHLDYLHQPRYPGLGDLDAAERRRVLAARPRALLDRSLDWQYPPSPEEPLGLYDWKKNHLHRVLREVLAASRFLDPERGNALVLLSDHGPRVGLELENFGAERFYGVPLVTFGIPVRDPETPISLLDVPALLGLPRADRPGPAEPVVEYAAPPPGELDLAKAGVPLHDGGVSLSRDLLASIAGRLTAFRPYTEPLGYAPALVTVTDSSRR